jgi:hypothetical protein
MDIPEDAIDHREAQTVLASARLAEARQLVPGAGGPTPQPSKADVMAVLAAVFPEKCRNLFAGDGA